jgi:hypothetical protein
MVKGENMVFKLLRSLYGLKHSPHAWNHKFMHISYLQSLKIIMLTKLYISKGFKNSFVIITLYVDTILVSNDFTLFKKLKKKSFEKI